MERRPSVDVSIPASSRLFTKREATALVPTLQLSFAALAEMRHSAESILDELSGGDPDVVVEILRGEVEPAAEDEERVERLQELIDGIGKTVEELTGLGLVIEEIDPGVVDFPSLREGRVVMLCWQFGEPSVEYFHELEGEFEEREPLPHTHPMLS